MALTIARTESQLSATTSFQAMDNLMASTVSSSFVVPSGVSRIVSVEIAQPLMRVKSTVFWCALHQMEWLTVNSM